MTVTEVIIKGELLYYEIRNDAGMYIGSAIQNQDPFDGFDDVTLEDAKKNATLWAAAPELLEALEKMTERLATMIDEKEGRAVEDDEVVKAFTIIKKAKGL